MSKQCQAVSPESGAPCVLADTLDAHYKGHESDWQDGLKIAWAKRKQDYLRWAKR